MSAFNKEVIYRIDSFNFEDFVMSKYGGELSFVAQHEANNDSCYDFNVPNSTKFFGTEAEDIRSGNYKNHSISKIFSVLQEDNHIEPGKYLVEVCW